MTLQQIADYAMEYLHDKDIAAEYDIYDNDRVRVSFNRSSVGFGAGDNEDSIKYWIDYLIKSRTETSTMFASSHLTLPY